jgi:hemerythrin-like domain-containing protein
LRHQRDPKVAAALATVERLERDHATAGAWHRELDALGNCWLEQSVLDAAAAARFRDLATQLSQLYEKHIQVEDNELFPLAASSLPASDLSIIGREMAERRGARVPSALAASSINSLK